MSKKLKIMLKIKDIRQYRSHFKNEVRQASGRNEHSISSYTINSTTGKKEFGWFDLYHGATGSDNDTQEEGIRKFLLGFLNIAKDAQAVYEFLQNAVDAGSSHFSMIWGKDEVDGKEYLLVANNGKMFTENNVASILNIGASTKSNEEQGIGKFGIGFKLAHRLVGRGDGLDELINDFAGPVLFSWKNNDINQLANLTDLELSDYRFNENEQPWLFKILLTCFPCLPQYNQVKDEVSLFDGKSTNQPLFGQPEMEALSRWTKKLLDKNTETSFDEGALFFMELGEGKTEKLKDENLNEGVKFSLGILDESRHQKRIQKLSTVQLNNDNTIILPELLYEKFAIQDTEKDFETVFPNQEGTQAPLKEIEILIGFKPYNDIHQFFKGAPNFYLYFPLSEEVHQFNFILHSNAFDNSSSRTFLQQGTGGEKGRNEKLFRIIVKRIGLRLEVLLSNNQQRFLDFYAAILTSGTSRNDNRKWIDGPFIEPLNKLLKVYVPVRRDFNSEAISIAKSNQKVYIKRTEIDIDLEEWELKDIRWFYWSEKTYPDFKEKAIEKLTIYPYTIFDLLKNQGISEKLNQWIEEDPNRIDLILKELQSIKSDEKETTIIDNLKELKIIHFSNGQLSSFSELPEIQSRGFLVLHRSLVGARKLFEKLGFKTSQRKLEDHPIIEKMVSYQSNHSQLKNYTELVSLFSNAIDEDLMDGLSLNEKYELYNCFQKLNQDSVPQRMAELKLFKNQNGKYVKLKNLLKTTDKSWLTNYVINPNELRSELSYLVEKPAHVYEQVIVPFWEQIGNHMIKFEDRANILNEIIKYYEISESKSESKSKLSDQGLVFFNNALIHTEPVFYTNGLVEIESEMYQKMQMILHTHFNMLIPDQWYLPFLQEVVFAKDSAQLKLECDRFNLGEDDLEALLTFASKSGENLFEYLLVQEQNDSYLIDQKDVLESCFTTNLKLRNYIQEYYSDQLLVLPDQFSNSPQKPVLNNGVLIQHLIEDFKNENKSSRQNVAFTETLLSEGKGVQNKWFLQLDKIHLDLDWTEEKNNTVFVELCKNMLDFYEEEKETHVSDKLILSGIDLSTFPFVSDSVMIQKDEREFSLSVSKILNQDNHEVIGQIHDFSQSCVLRELLTPSQAKKLFKLEQSKGLSVEQFNHCLRESKLQNAAQLAFVLLSDQIDPAKKKKYQILAANGDWYQLDGTLFPYSCVQNHLIDDSYRLAEQYDSLEELIQLNGLEPFKYGENDDDLILSRFVFRTGCDPEIFAEEVDVIDVLDYLYESWSLSNRDFLVSKKDKRWQSVFGFEPQDRVYHKLKIESESLPIELENWINEEESKTTFIQFLGVQTEESPLIQLRKYLTRVNTTIDDNEWMGLTNLQLSNTLVFLANLENVYFEEITPQLATINIIQQRLEDDNEPDIPVFVYQPNAQVNVVDPLHALVFQLDDEIHNLLKEQQAEKLELLYTKANILFRNESILQDSSAIPSLNLIKDFQPEEVQEHAEYFYKEWSEINRIKLWKAKELPIDITVEIEDESLNLGRISKPNWLIKENESGFDEIYYTDSTPHYLLARHKEKGDNKYVEEIEEYLKLREDSFKVLSESAPEIGEYIDRIAKKQNLINERKKFLDQLKNEIRYSHKWFIAYLGYLDTFNETEEEFNRKSLAFQTATYHEVENRKSHKHFYLKGAGQIIPDSIELFEDLEIELRYRNRKKEKLKVEGVTKKGQDLLVHYPEGLDAMFLMQLAEVERAEVYFTPKLDLFKRLRNAFNNTGYIAPWHYFEDTLPGLHFIYGPPGTGKTTKLSKKVINGINQNSKKRFLILTPTNKAADVLTDKILKEVPESYIYRLGHATDPDLEYKFPHLYQKAMDEDLLDKANVIVSTIHRLPYFSYEKEDGVGNKLIQLTNHWDQIIFDEASMINLTYMVFALKALQEFNPNADFIVAGDPKQIPPIESLSDQALEEMEIADENIYKMLQIESFQEAYEDKLFADGKHTVKTLDKQFRSVDDIGELYSQFAYNGLLNHRRTTNAKKLPQKLQAIFSHPISFIKFPLNKEHSIYKAEKLNKSPYHLYGAILAMEMVIAFDKEAKEEANHHWKIGIINPYRAHDMLTNKMISAYPFSEFTSVQCSTVHGFQGDECDIIIFTATPNNHKYTGDKRSLLSKEYLYNVAISRAQQNLWVMHPEYESSNNPFIQNLIQIAEKNNACNHLHSSAIEKELLFKNDFIENGSYHSGHDPINIFSKPDQNYFIKASQSAIDIQLRDINRW